MKRTDLPKNIQDLLQRVRYATIATVCSDGQPWCTPMVAHFDNDLNLYWPTNKFSQHIQNIQHEPRIFVTVYDTHVPENISDIDALYMQMRAGVLSTPEMIALGKQQIGMSFSDNLPEHHDFPGDCPRRFIKATPLKLWHCLDVQCDGHTIDSRQEILSTEQ